MALFHFLDSFRWSLYAIILLIAALLPQAGFWPRIRKAYRTDRLEHKTVLSLLLLMFLVEGYCVFIGFNLPSGVGGEFLVEALFQGLFIFPVATVLLTGVFHRKFYWKGVLQDFLGGNRVATFLALSGLGLSLLGAYMTWVEPFWLDVTQVSVRLGRLQGLRRPLKILQISDTHFDNPWPGGYSFIPEAYARARKAFEPDLVFLTGDFINDAAPDQYLPFFQSLQAPKGVYAVHGNFSFGDNNLLAQCPNIRFLEDSAVTLDVEGARFALIGMGFNTFPDLPSVVKELPRDIPKLVLCHTPDVFPLARKSGIDMVFAGHTHGGQVCVPLYGAIITLTELGPAYASGLFFEEGTYLYINRGLGLEPGNISKIRFWCRPEVTCMTLYGPEVPTVPGYFR